MSIKTRLLVSYIAMVIIPIIISAAVSWIIIFFSVKNFINTYNVKLGNNPIKEIMNKTSGVFADMENVAKNNPEEFLNEAYLKKLDRKLSIINTGILLRQDDRILYISKNLVKDDIINKLPPFGYNDMEKHSRIFLGNQCITDHMDFYFSDGSMGSIFLITDTYMMDKLIIKIIFMIIVSVILIFIATDGFLTYHVSKKITVPLNGLKNAAVKIKEGDMDFQLTYNNEDEFGEVYSAFEDMRKKLKASTEVQKQYERNRKELISNISHDLKTPITAIKGYVEGIMDGVADTPEKMDRYIKTIYTKANHMDKLIDELFLFSRLDLNKIPFEFENIDLREYMQDSIEELEFDLEKQGISLNYSSKVDKPLYVKADRQQLRRVILNIIGNSIKYMNKEEKTISISLEETSDFALIMIKDNGMGVPKEDIPYIFDRFYRVDPSRNTSTGGSGLGLAIAKLIIDEHGGSIWMDSEENQGTSVSFTLKKWAGNEVKQ